MTLLRFHTTLSRPLLHTRMILSPFGTATTTNLTINSVLNSNHHNSNSYSNSNAFNSKTTIRFKSSFLEKAMASVTKASKNTNSLQPHVESKQGAASTVAQKLLGVSAVGYTAVKIGGSLKIVLPILKLAKCGPLLSMGLTTIAYGAIFGPVYGLGMVGMLFSSQLGSGLARYQFGLPIGSSMFIPFLGSMTTTGAKDGNNEFFESSYDRDGNEIRPSAYRDALIAISGPGACLCTTIAIPFAYSMLTNAQWGFALSDFGFMLTLISLAPIGAMPGGTIVQALNKWFLPGGLGILTGYLALGSTGVLCSIGMASPSPILYLVWIMGAYRTYQVFRPDQAAENLEMWRRRNGYYDTSKRQKIFLSIGYVTLLITALSGQSIVARYKKDPRTIRQELMQAEQLKRYNEYTSNKNTQNQIQYTDPNSNTMLDPNGGSKFTHYSTYNPPEEEVIGGFGSWALNSLDSWEQSGAFDESEVLRY